MNIDAHNRQFIQQLCNYKIEAEEFVELWHKYCHLIDDIVDGDSALDLRVFSMANELYSCEFYVAHRHKLKTMIQVVTCIYEDSVRMEKSTIHWQKYTADVIRHSGADILRAVAYLCGGYQLLRKMSFSIHEVCYIQHHDKGGKGE
jgi:hypothetical protein